MCIKGLAEINLQGERYGTRHDARSDVDVADYDRGARCEEYLFTCTYRSPFPQNFTRFKICDSWLSVAVAYTDLYYVNFYKRKEQTNEIFASRKKILYINMYIRVYIYSTDA